MGQSKRLDISNDSSKIIKPIYTKPDAINKGMESNGIVFESEVIMGVNNIQHRYKLPVGDVHSFFNRFGNYRLSNFYTANKKMEAIAKMLVIWILNLFGISVYVYWLTIDFDSIKGIITAIIALGYSGMKLYEKFLDIRERKKKKPPVHHHKKKQDELNY